MTTVSNNEILSAYDALTEPEQAAIQDDLTDWILRGFDSLHAIAFVFGLATAYNESGERFVRLENETI